MRHPNGRFHFPRWMGLALASAASVWSVAAQAAFYDSAPPPPRQPVWGAPGPRLGSRLGLVASEQVAASLPSFAFWDRAKPSVQVGGGIGGEFRFSSWHATRLTGLYGWDRFSAKGTRLVGNVDTHTAIVRLDYVYGATWWRPYGGIGLGMQFWNGKITEDATDLSNADKGRPLVGMVAIGCDFNLLANLSLAPEAAWTPVGGDFRTMLWRAGLVVRWAY